MWNWNSLAGNNYLALGTNLKYYIQNGPDGLFYDITPVRGTPQTVASNAFTTVNASTTVTVNASGHGAQTGDFVTISGVGGAINGIPAAALNKEFQITYLNTNQFNITVSSPATCTGTTGSATFTYQITTGLATYTIATGWGAGGWGGYASGSATTTLNGGINSSATSIVLTSASGFTSSGTIVIDTESITYSGVSTNTLTGCVRGANGTTAAAHLTGATVTQVILEIGAQRQIVVASQRVPIPHSAAHAPIRTSRRRCGNTIVVIRSCIKNPAPQLLREPRTKANLVTVEPAALVSESRTFTVYTGAELEFL